MLGDGAGHGARGVEADDERRRAGGRRGDQARRRRGHRGDATKRSSSDAVEKNVAHHRRHLNLSPRRCKQRSCASRATTIGWIGLVMLVVCTTAPTLRDPPYWDANVYVREGRWAAAHGLSLDAWRHFPDVLKPPVFAALRARRGRRARDRGGRGAARDAPAVLASRWRCSSRCGRWCARSAADERQALVAGALCAIAPLYVAQAGLVLSDLPMTALATWAWVALVRGRLRRVAGPVGARGADQGERVLPVRAGVRARVAARGALAAARPRGACSCSRGRGWCSPAGSARCTRSPATPCRASTATRSAPTSSSTR